MPETFPFTHAADILIDIECVRLFMWQWLLSRKEMHLSHMACATGMRAQLGVGAAPRDIEGTPFGQRVHYGYMLEPWLGFLLQVREYMTERKTPGAWIERVTRHHQAVQHLHSRLTSPHLPFQMSSMPLAPTTPPEEPPCGNAHSQAAEPESPPACSPAEPTGSPSPPTSETPCGSATMTSRGVPSSLKNSAMSSGASSSKRYKKGTGHPKRGNPNTRGKKR